MSDLQWLTDMDPFAVETETELEELEQDCIHVIEQDLGSNLDDPDRGVGVANILSSVLNGAAITKSTENNLQQDDRVDSALATIETDNDGTVTLNVTISVGDIVLDVALPISGAI